MREGEVKRESVRGWISRLRVADNMSPRERSEEAWGQTSINVVWHERLAMEARGCEAK